MKQIYKYILRSYAGPLVLTFSISLFILVMQFLWKYIDDLVGKGLEWYIITELLFYATATFVPLALPLAILFASLMTFGNLGEKYELVAMKAAGISLSRIMRPLIYLSIFISISAFFFSNNVLPVANLKMFTLLNDVRQKKPAVNIRPGIFYSEIEGVVIKIGKKDADGKGVEDILIYDYSTPEASRYNCLNLTMAKKGRIELTPDERFLKITLFNGVNYSEKIQSREQITSRPLQRTTFSSQQKTIDLSAFAFQKTNEEFFKDDFRMLSVAQLNTTIDSLYLDYSRDNDLFQKDVVKAFRNIYNDTLPADPPPEASPLVLEDSVMKERRPYNPLYGDSVVSDILGNFTGEEQRNIAVTAEQLARSAKESIHNRHLMLTTRIRLIRKYEIEWHRKFTLSIACLILFFIGAPLGAIIRKGGLGMPAVLSVVLFIIFHVLSMTGDKLARESTVTPAAGMWMASLIILPAGVFLTWKATSDAPLLDAETYAKLWRRVRTAVSSKFRTNSN
ncbi:MAG TPA: LptF/LptG family permease [Bacteroidales bacterium]|nr:LptF/LptG family permease [Bacteroidales bacterium]HRZ49122.1 LptF/LptG family permease [Bacteroidales bacterium]